MYTCSIHNQFCNRKTNATIKCFLSLSLSLSLPIINHPMWQIGILLRFCRTNFLHTFLVFHPHCFWIFRVSLWWALVFLRYSESSKPWFCLPYWKFLISFSFTIFFSEKNLICFFSYFFLIVMDIFVVLLNPISLYTMAFVWADAVLQSPFASFASL